MLFRVSLLLTAPNWRYSKCLSIAVKNLPPVRVMQVWSLGREDLLEEERATHSSILAWDIPCTEKPGGLQSMGSQSLRQNLVTKHQQGEWCAVKSYPEKVLAFAFSNWEVIFRPLDIPLHRTDFLCLGAWPPINLTKCFMMDESLGHSVSVLTFNGLETKDQLCGSMLSSTNKKLWVPKHGLPSWISNNTLHFATHWYQQV